MAGTRLARNQIIQYVSSHPTTANEFLKVVRAAALSVGNPDQIMYTKEEFCEELRIPLERAPLNQYSRQKLDFYKVRLNAIGRNALQLTPEWNNYFTTLTNIFLNTDVNMPALAELNVNAPDFNDLWRAMSEDQLLAYFEMRGLSIKADTSTMSIQATIVALISFIKGETMTGSWLESRMERCRPLNPAIDWDQVFKEELIKTFHLNFGSQSLSVDDIHKILQSIYSMYDEEALLPIRWMIEQSIVKNVTLAVTFADCVIKSMHVALDKLIELIGEQQFKALVILALNLMYDKLCAFVKPPVVVAEYADLAYIGYYIELTERGKNKNIAFAGNPIKKATKNRTDLEVIANSLLRFSEASITADMSALDIVNDAQGDVIIMSVVQDAKRSYP